MELDSCLTAPPDWPRRTISEICERFTSGGTPSRARPEFYGGRIPWVKTKELTDRTLWNAEECITEAGLAGSSAKLLPAGTVLMAMYGATVGKLGRLGVPMACNQACAAMVVDGNRADASYLYFQLKLNRSKIVSSASGAAQQNLSGLQIKNFILPFPGVREQRLIGGLLASLDEKIELNRRMNETLEAMAQAIFRDWFVDFGPVRRKMEGATDPVAIMGGLTSDPARAAELAALFPAALGEDELPVGWGEHSIGEQVEIVGGSTPSTADERLWTPAEHRWATPKDLSGMADLALFETGRRISGAGVAKITSGLLPAGTVLLSSRAPIGYLAIAQEPVAINQGFIALKPTTSLGSAYLYLWCKANMDAILANANGSTFQEISKKNFRPITSAIPGDVAIVRAFDDVARPLIERIVAAARENRTLTETRDYLLPRLMSGQVRVGRREAMVA